MTDQTDRTPKTTRGTGFPALPLDDAVAAVKQAGKYGRVHSDAAFAGYLGHSTTNSGPFRTKMASLRDWGLIERPKDGQVPFTELGHKIAHPTGDELELLREAFFNADPFAVIYNESAKGTDLSLDLVGNRAVTAIGVSAPNKTPFAESFRRSVIAAGLGREGAAGTIHLVPPDSEGEAGTKTEADNQTETDTEAEASSAKGSSTSRTRRLGASPILHQAWSVPGGQVIFEVELDGPLPGSAFAGVGDVITAVEEFVKTLEPGSADTPSSEDANAAD